MELTRENFRAMIYYDFRRGLSRQECIDQFTSTFGDKAPSFATVKRWYNEFNRGRRSLTDESREGRPKSVVVSENIDAVQKLIMQDRHVIYCEIETTLGISSTSIYKILHDHLAVKKVCSRWIPHNLTKSQKDARVDWCKQVVRTHAKVYRS
ncbi:Histone-lysine N-methyltransferase SETMAR [Trachymyrmex zeteki]|uniref:Histone-lysine N-methyltransferase SETMAR n=1 Tax=Mycetomoellerius zeteki TaxID=64791 RepID=A0A151WKF7_9HYME|nr:Histone-lysine N-methyltransferase SETMAR [Trachymyrmex zeteki]